MTTDLASALRGEAMLEAMRAFLALLIAARDYSQASRGKHGGTARAFEALERAAATFYAVESEWSSLVRCRDDWLTHPGHATADTETVHQWRLRHHVRRYIPWTYPVRGRPDWMSFEHWDRIFRLRGKAWMDAVRQMEWEGIAP